MANISACLLHSLLPTPQCVFCNSACIPQALKMPLKFLMGTRPLSFIYFNNINPLFCNKGKIAALQNILEIIKSVPCKQKFRLFAVPYHIQFTNPLILSAYTLNICNEKALENKVDLIPMPMGV